MTTTSTRSAEDAPAAPVPAEPTAPRQSRSQLGLVRMLQAGRELIESSGNLDDLSINEIVERAGTSIGAFYRRFDNKDSFFEVLQAAAMQEGLEILRDGLARNADWHSDDAGTLADAVVDLYVSAFRRNRGLYHASLLRTSQRKGSWDAVKATNHEALALIVPRLASALARARGLKSAAPAAALEFEIRAALQLILGMLVNCVLNDPGPLTLGSRALRPWLQTQLRRCLALADR